MIAVSPSSPRSRGAASSSLGSTDTHENTLDCLGEPVEPSQQRCRDEEEHCRGGGERWHMCGGVGQGEALGWHNERTYSFAAA